MDTGDTLRLWVDAGVASVKSLATGGGTLTLFRLNQDQSFEFVYRGANNENLSVEAAVPRRVERDRGNIISLSVLGAPLDTDRIRVYVGGPGRQPYCRRKQR